ncbi:Gamma-tubulin complex component 3 [Apophysomyces sp. BC1034]|nr:Gamma-tubulin complex component 3 [Apophysomyces sp. BC1034]
MSFYESTRVFLNENRPHVDRTALQESGRYALNPTRLASTIPSDDPALDPRTAQTLQKLVQRFSISNADDLTLFANEHLQKTNERLFDQCARTLTSHAEASVLQDENHVANMIRRKLMRDPKNSAKSSRFGHLYNKLASQPILKNKWAILYFLYLVSEQNEQANTTSPVSSSMDTSPFISAGLQSISPRLQPPISRPYEMTQDSPRNTRRKLAREREPSSQRKYTTSSDTSLPPSVQLARAREKLCASSETEQTGIDGQYIKFNPDTNDYSVEGNVNIFQPVKDMVFHLTELGWQYRKVHSFVKSKFEDPTMGLVGQSFCSALQRELTDYYKLIAVLEAQIEKQTMQLSGVDNTSLPNEHTLTLKRLFVWTKESLERLKLMSALVDVCRDQKGGTLVSTMHDHTNHGDPFIYRYISEMLQEVSKPFYEMLQRWIYEGELDDPYEEFFVACDPMVPEEELWQSKYSIREDMLPNFISRELAQKIFSIGKSLNFIRYSCHDDTLVEKYYAPTTSHSAMPTFKYGDIQAVERSIDVTYLETSKQLLDLLKHKYKLMEHLRALKRYLLLGQGDFIQHLMDTLGPGLSKPAYTLLRHNLTGVLETAIRSSNAQYDDPEILNRLDVRLLEISSEDLGWDVFTLDYHVDSPINTVFSPQAMNQYLKMFNFLWRLKRVEYTLSASWRRWGTASRSFANIPGKHTNRRMVHFIYQLQHYYLFEVLECSWEKLVTYIENKSIDLDSIIEAHSQYLGEISRKGFLSGQKNKDQLHYFSTTEKKRRADTGSITIPIQDLDKLQRIRSRCTDTENKFKVQVLEFLAVLASYHDEDLRSLSTRLDYNDYYGT